MDATDEFLKEITEAPGVPGFEGPVREVLERHLKGCGKLSKDNLGSLICEKNGTARSPKIMLDGHLDEIGLMVKHIDNNGFIKFAPLGGWFDQVMLSQRVTVHSQKGDLPGVIGSKPPHLLKPDERKKMTEKSDMFIDVGAADKKQAEGKFGIRLGDPITPWSPFTQMANPKLLMAKAWDDRVGTAVMVDVMRKLKAAKHPNTVFGVGSVQEEVGLRGATTSVHCVEPDVGIALESGIAGDTPGIKPEEALSKLGGGVCVLAYDASMIPNIPLRDFTLALAKRKRIKVQVDVMERGGTDANKIHLFGRGVPSIVLGVPARYIHAHVGIIHRDDYSACVKLVYEMVMALGAKTVKSFTN